VPNTTYLEKLENHIKVIKYASGNIGKEEGLILFELQENGINSIIDDDNDELKAVTTVAKDNYQAVAFLLSADRNRYRKILEDMETDSPPSLQTNILTTSPKPTSTYLPTKTTQEALPGS